MQITLTSSDPARLRLSTRPDAPGTESISVPVNPGVEESAEFWVHALADSGQAIYTATAPGFDAAAKGTVTFTPSAIAILGPLRAPKFQTTLRADPITINFNTVRLDPSMHFVEAQPVRAGLSLKFEVANSNPAAGTVTLATLTIESGASSEVFRHPGGVVYNVAWLSDGKSFLVSLAQIDSEKLAVTAQYSSGMNARISRSRSTTSRTATLCTRPAERPLATWSA